MTNPPPSLELGTGYLRGFPLGVATHTKLPDSMPPLSFWLQHFKGLDIKGLDILSPIIYAKYSVECESRREIQLIIIDVFLILI